MLFYFFFVLFFDYTLTYGLTIFPSLDTLRLRSWNNISTGSSGALRRAARFAFHHSKRAVFGYLRRVFSPSPIADSPTEWQPYCLLL